MAGGKNFDQITIEDNQSRHCFSIRDGSDLIHFCDAEALIASIRKHQSERTEPW